MSKFQIELSICHRPPPKESSLDCGKKKNEQKTATWGLDATIAFSQLFFIVNKWQEDLNIVPYFGSYNTTLFI